MGDHRMGPVLYHASTTGGILVVSSGLGCCEWCGAALQVSNPRALHRFCSRPCYHRWLRRNRLPRTCETCGRQFTVNAARPRVSGARFCSRACAGCAKRERVAVTCAACGKVFEGRPGRGSRYCSQACYHAATRTKAVLTCAVCGRPFRVAASLVGVRKHCSRECARVAGRKGETR